MSDVKEVISRLMQVHGLLAPITERLLDIEARLAAAKACDIERPAKLSLRKYSSNLLGETHCQSSRTIKIERYGTAVRQ
jgi:hypothetical protein